MLSEISHFFRKTSKIKHDEHEEHGKEGCYSSSIPVGTLDDSRVIGNDSAEVNTSSIFRKVSITECSEVNQVVEAILICCVHCGCSSE